MLPASQATFGKHHAIFHKKASFGAWDDKTPHIGRSAVSRIGRSASGSVPPHGADPYRYNTVGARALMRLQLGLIF